MTAVPAPEWVRNMIEHYGRTSTYRPQDLHRLLGDQTKGVEVAPQGSFATYMSDYLSKAD